MKIKCKKCKKKKEITNYQIKTFFGRAFGLYENCGDCTNPIIKIINEIKWIIYCSIQWTSWKRYGNTSGIDLIVIYTTDFRDRSIEGYGLYNYRPVKFKMIDEYFIKIDGWYYDIYELINIFTGKKKVIELKISKVKKGTYGYKDYLKLKKLKLGKNNLNN